MKWPFQKPRVKDPDPDLVEAQRTLEDHERRLCELEESDVSGGQQAYPGPDRRKESRTH